MASTYGSNALKGGGPSMSMVDNMGSMGIGNYKGVMLCNRPFGGTQARVTSGGGGEKTTFNCGVVMEPAGLNVPISHAEKMLKRPNKDSVLAKHKKWLHELQKTKDRLEEQYVDEAKKKEEAQQKFQEHEKRMRLAARTVLRGEDDKDGAKGSGNGPESSYGGYEVLEDEQAQAQAKHSTTSSSSARAAPAKDTAGSKHSHAQAKPAWAMTEKAADDQYDDLRLDEENDLLDFAKSLDFDKFIGDVEVQTVMERLRKRISDLERDVATKDLRNSDAEMRAAMRAKLEQMGITEASLMSEDRRGPLSEENAALNAARALLQEEEDMQAVHSAKSVAALLKTAKDKIAQIKTSVHPGIAAEPKITNEPIIITHDPSEGSRLENKNAISKLPYMNRNPAV